MLKRSTSTDGPEPSGPTCREEDHARPSGEAAGFSDGSFERATRMLRAVGDEARLRLLELLRNGEMCVTEIASVTGEGMSTISQRLRVLRGEGLVSGRREGKHVYYSLADGHVEDLILNVLSHASEDQRHEGPRGRNRKMSENVHTGHDHVHVHGPDCEHAGVRHDGHVDYLHEGHLHHQREDGTVEEHALPVGGENPAECTPDHEMEHDPDHRHGSGCGHEPVPHGDHTDYLVDGHLHHPHGDHCDNHGPLEIVA